MHASPRLSQFLPLIVAAVVLLATGQVRAQPPPRANAEKVYVAYRLTRGDEISVGVLGEPDMSAAQKRIEAVGTINLPYVGDVRLVGLTIKEAQDLIANAFRDHRILRNPTVTIIVEKYEQRIVSVSGKVNQQGRIHIPPDTQTTIIDLIFLAGGLAETARASEIRVTRTMPDGSNKYFTLNIDAAMKGKNKSASGDAAFVMEPDDMVFVPEKII
jgi:protein involved in polysaccharide export with SLBB domain